VIVVPDAVAVGEGAGFVLEGDVVGVVVAAGDVLAGDAVARGVAVADAGVPVVTDGVAMVPT
jgi:hypothetical protein